MNRFEIALGFCLVLLCAGACQGAALGVASDYNLFVLNNFAPGCCDAGGAVAANSISLGSSYFSFAADQARVVSSQAAYTPAYGLVVGTTITAPATDHVIVDAGNAYEGTVSGRVSFQPATDPTGVESTGNPAPINFATAGTALQSESTFLAGQTSTVAVTNDPSYGLDIAASGTGTSFATITAAQLNMQLHLTVAANQTLVINVTGTTASTYNGGIFVNGNQLSGDSGTAAERILFNFTGTSFTLNETFAGSLLAPFAAVIGTNYQELLGNLVASSFSGNTEFHDLLFTGSVPTPIVGTSTPEPMSTLLMGGGLLALCGLAQKFRTRR